jgi:hypothetical protein
MHTFRCQNPECKEESPVGAIEWIDEKHVVECWHCQQIHALRQLPSEKGATIRFEIAGLVDD